MSFYTVTADKKPVHATDSYLFEDEDLFCPSCGCKMHYVSAVSNRRAAHFSGKHLSGCDIGIADSSCVDPYHYKFPEDSVQGILDLVIRQGVKQPSSNGSANSKHGVPAGTERKGTINTIRQLFNFCVSVDPSTVLPDGNRVKDIYCGRSTTFLYKKFVSRPHLMYAQYNGHTADYSALFFCYPSIEEVGKQNGFTIAVRSVRVGTLKTAGGTLSIGDYALILADFKGKHCDIESPAQVVPVKKAKR